jgi:multidrug transporter EmrE-like cation transporter
VLTGLLFTLCAMILNSVAGLLQAAATRRVHHHRPLVTQPGYLTGLAVDGLGWVCTAVALRHLPVFAVQAVLGGTIAVTTLAARLLYGSKLQPVDRIAVGACLVGLVLVAASAGADEPSDVSVTAYVVLFSTGAGLAVAAVALWNSSRAWPLAIVAGLGFGGTSLAVRAVHLPAGSHLGVVGLLTQPAPYLVLAYCAIGLSSYSRALGLGTVSRVTAVFMVTEVLFPGFIGIAVLGDAVRADWWPSLAAGLVLAVAGVIVLAHSPAQSPPGRVRVR